LNSLQSQITPEDIIRAATLRLGIGSSVSPVDSCFNGLKWKLETIHGLFAQELATLSGDELDLRPKHNPIVVARKPLEGTVIKNVLKHGTGAINVGACGVETNGDTANARKDKSGGCQFFMGGDKRGPTEWKGDSNRWPANVIHDGSEEVLACFPQESSQTGNRRNKNRVQQEAQATPFTRGQEAPEYTDGGSPARFFKTCRFRYVSKASPGERNLGCEGLPLKESIRGDDRIGGKGTGYERLGGSDKPLNKTGSVSPVRNTHPTVKPLSLMCYLTRLVTPPGGVVLDHFMGSGSTLIGAAKEGFDAVGIDLGAENCRIAEARCRGHLGMPAEVNIAAQRPQGGGENLKEE
jgi:site-specific DNA-methyltransferase (adenine-specific)